MTTGYQGNFIPAKPAIIAAAGTKTAALDLGGFSLVGIKFPATFTGTAVTFEVCDTIDGTFVPLYNASGAVSLTIAQARFYAVDPKDFQGIQFMKLVSGSTEGSERILLLALKGI